MKIIKASGDKEIFDRNKIIKSLKRSGVKEEIIAKVLSDTEKELFEGIQTKKIYKIVFQNLKKYNRNIAGKYHLKKAILELGPTGFLFEKFIAALFESEGFQTTTNQIVRGYCVNHEVDVIAKKNKEYFIIECKFHQKGGIICDIKNALYVYARFLDIEQSKFYKLYPGEKIKQGWLVTNTRFSSDTERYGRCAGLGLLSWNYPKRKGLREKIDKNGLYPITCLTRLSKEEKQKLLNNNIVLCSSLYETPSKLKFLGLSKARKSKVMEEVKIILKKY